MRGCDTTIPKRVAEPSRLCSLIRRYKTSATRWAQKGAQKLVIAFSESFSLCNNELLHSNKAQSSHLSIWKFGSSSTGCPPGRAGNLCRI